MSESTTVAPFDLDAYMDAPPEKIPEIKVAIKTTAARASGGLSQIVAEGDSWFDYWILLDMVDCLQGEFGWQISNYARHGDTLENMLVGNRTDSDGNRVQPGISAALAELRAVNAKVLILSGGGNDIAGDEFYNYLNHKDSGESDLLKVAKLEEMIHGNMRSWIVSTITKVQDINQTRLPDDKCKIFMHGYGYAYPSGKGLGFGWGPTLSGPWLQPSLLRKGITDIKVGAILAERLIDMYNEMLGSLMKEYASEFEYVNLRGEIDRYMSPANEGDWGNELHLTRRGYRKAAREFGKKIKDHLSRNSRP